MEGFYSYIEKNTKNTFECIKLNGSIRAERCATSIAEKYRPESGVEPRASGLTYERSN